MNFNVNDVREIIERENRKHPNTYLKRKLEHAERLHKITIKGICALSTLAAIGLTGAVLCTKSIIGQVNDQSAVTIGKIGKLVITGAGAVIGAKYALSGSLSAARLYLEEGKEEKEEIKALKKRLSEVEDGDESSKEKTKVR